MVEVEEESLCSVFRDAYGGRQCELGGILEETGKGVFCVICMSRQKQKGEVAL